MTPLQQLCGALGVRYRPGKPHQHALPLGKALSAGELKVSVANLSEDEGDLKVFQGRTFIHGAFGAPITDFEGVVAEAPAWVLED